jgi:hypothetical protein
MLDQKIRVKHFSVNGKKTHKYPTGSSPINATPFYSDVNTNLTLTGLWCIPVKQLIPEFMNGLTSRPAKENI